jgi:uncharacterized membrane protein
MTAVRVDAPACECRGQPAADAAQGSLRPAVAAGGRPPLKPLSGDPNALFDRELTFGERAADLIAGFGGSWTFILLFLGTLAAWILINVELLPRNRVFDPYPFILLNLALSLLATLQAPVIMMSQNRQARRDRLDAAHDYEVNLRAEIEIRSLHEKLDALQQDRWAELIALQERQLELLEGLRPAPQHAAEATLPTARAASGAWQSP